LPYTHVFVVTVFSTSRMISDAVEILSVVITVEADLALRG